MSFRLEDLTNNDNYFWRIDWFGYISYFDRNGNRRSQPLVEVFLSKLSAYNPHQKLDVNPLYSQRSQRKILIPIEYLRLLYIGDIWYQGKPISSPSYDSITAFRVTVDPQDFCTRRASFKLENEVYLVPFATHPYHSKAAGVLCEVITAHQGVQLVIPSWVLLQAYFSSCPYLLCQAFQFGMVMDTLFDSAKSKIVGGHAQLRVRKWVHDSGAPDLARVIWDPAARKAYSMVSDSLAMSQVNGSRVSPKTTFPFVGSTDLEVRGVFLTERRNRFLVYEIKSCSASYPFLSLNISRDNPGRKCSDTDRKAVNQSISIRKTARVPNQIELLPNAEPLSGLDKISLSVDRRIKMLSLDHSRISKTDQSGATDESSIIKPHDFSIGAVGIGNAQGNCAPVSLDFTQNFELSENTEPSASQFIFSFNICRLSIFERVVELLQRSSLISHASFIRLGMTADNSISHYSTFPRTFTASGKERLWRYIKFGDGGKFSLRKVLVAEIRLMNSRCYLFEVQRRTDKSLCGKGWIEHDDISTLLMYRNDGSAMNPHELSDRLYVCAKLSGRWQDSNERARDDVTLMRLKHPKNTTTCDMDRHINLLHEGIVIKILSTSLI